MDLEGTIYPTSLPSLIHSVCATRETGQLLLRREGSEKSIYLKEGQIIFATSNDREDRLGQVLLREGIVGVEKLERATEESLREGKRLGAVLVEYGWIEPDKLVKGVVRQVEEILFGVFEWTNGSYHLTLGDHPTRELITLKMDTADLAVKGIRRIRSWYRIREAIGGLDTVYRQCDGAEKRAAQIQLTDAERKLLSRLSEPAPLRDLFGWGTAPDFEVGQSLWIFQGLRLVTRTSPDLA